MNIRDVLILAKSMPCNQQQLETVTGLSPVAVRRLIEQIRSVVLGMIIE